MLALRLAWRYATRRAVNYVAVAAIALALAVQLVATGVLNGQVADLERRMSGLGQHVYMDFEPSPAWALPDFDGYLRLEKAIQALPGVAAVAPAMRREAVIRNPRTGQSAYAVVHGVDLARELAATRLASYLTGFTPDADAPGWFPEHMPRDGRPGGWVGRQLASSLGRLQPGDLFEIIYRDPGAPEGETPDRRVFRAGDLFASGWQEYDRLGVYVGLAEASGLFAPQAAGTGGDGRVGGVSVWLARPREADDMAPLVAEAIWNEMPQTGFYVQTWLESWGQMIEGMLHENRLVSLVLLLFMASTGFCVFAILSTLVSRRLKDMGLLRCLGATRRQVVAVFLTVGLYLGAAGASLGTAGALLLLSERDPVPGEAETAPRVWLDVLYERFTGDRLYPPRMFGIEGLVVELPCAETALYALGAVAVAVLAGLYPALLAASREPARALAEGG